MDGLEIRDSEDAIVSIPPMTSAIRRTIDTGLARLN